MLLQVHAAGEIEHQVRSGPLQRPRLQSQEEVQEDGSGRQLVKEQGFAFVDFSHCGCCPVIFGQCRPFCPQKRDPFHKRVFVILFGRGQFW